MNDDGGKPLGEIFPLIQTRLAAVQLVNASIKLAITFLLGARLQRDLFMTPRSKVFSTLRNHLSPFINLHFPG